MIFIKRRSCILKTNAIAYHLVITQAGGNRERPTLLVVEKKIIFFKRVTADFSLEIVPHRIYRT